MNEAANQNHEKEDDMKKNAQKAAVVVLKGLLLIALIVGMTSCPNAAGPQPPGGSSALTEMAKLVPSDGSNLDYFGESVSISGDYAIVGAEEHGSKGAAYIYVRSGTDWSEQEKITASDGANGDYFGCSVSINGDYAIVGAYGDDDKGSGAGAAYVFVRSGTDWTEQTKLTASDGAASDNFGESVSINGDSVIVSARGDDDKGSGAGAAYVFVRGGAVWTEQAKLTASDGAAE